MLVLRGGSARQLRRCARCSAVGFLLDGVPLRLHCRAGLLRRISDPRTHVSEDLAFGERTVVDPYLVDHAREPLAPELGSAYSQRTARDRDPSGSRFRQDLGAVAVEADVAPVERDGEVRPLAARNRRVRPRAPIGAADVCVAARPTAARVGIERIGECLGLLLDHHRPPGIAQISGPHPGFERHAAGQVERWAVGDVDEVVSTVERERPAVAALRRPRGADDHAGVAATRCVGDCRAATFLEGVGGNESALGLSRPRCRGARDGRNESDRD